MAAGKVRGDSQSRRDVQHEWGWPELVGRVLSNGLFLAFLLVEATTRAVVALARAMVARLRRPFDHGADGKFGAGGGRKRDPFEVLGLDGGRDGATVEEATKARRKLALKWHPDRNIDNAEEATKKMQEINDAFNQVERMLFEDANGGTEGETSDSECDDSFDSSRQENRSEGHRRRRRNKNSRRKKSAHYDEQAEFERQMDEEWNRFSRAHRAAQRGDFATNTNGQSAPPKKKGVKGQGRSKAAKKRAKKRNNQTGRMQPTKSSPAEDTSVRTAAARSVPFHRVSPEKRCEIKFESEFLLKTPIFTAIRARTWNVLHVLGQYDASKICDPIPLENEGLCVTPLMVACYLGDNEAASVIIQILGQSWAEGVMAKTRDGQDCLDLAEEALVLAKKFLEEAEREASAPDMPTGGRKKRETRETKVKQWRKDVEMATDLVERIRSLKQFALEKNKKRRRRRIFYSI